jgi:tetratricopeptide (TPR) repeat protein
MLRFLFIMALLAALPYTALGQASGQIHAAVTFLHNGNPEQAVITAQRALKKSTLTASERQTLLATIAKAETMRTTYQHFQGVDAAIQALEAAINEFPNSPDAPEFRWQQAWLSWQSGQNKQAITAAREIIAQDQQSSNLRRAWLLMARIHIQIKNYAYARSDLLQYGLNVRSNSREQAIGMAWMAIVDQGESRSDAAFKTLQAVYRAWPKVITDEAELFATYIDLVDRHEQYKQALQLANAFIRQYSNEPQSALVRLIRANLHAKQEKTIPTAIMEYSILAKQQAETTLGRKAFMRKLMLEFRHEKQREKLLPVLVSLKKIADENQLSGIEDEAMLDMARLWTRITPVATASNTGSKHAPPALEAYARAGASLDKHIAQAAKEEGSLWLEKYITALLEQQQWIKAVTIWRHYPQLRPTGHTSQTLRLGVAHAMRMLMLFNSAESMLQRLYSENRMSIRGQRIMMERARLWLDRRDSDGVKKIMHWLNRHEFSIYRPEMLLIVARMQLAKKQTELARQTLISVNANDLAVESRAHYWKTTAEISEALSEYHHAARAWAKYRQSKGADDKMGLNNQAANLFMAREFIQARKLYLQMPEDKRNAAWQYHMGVCQLRSGEVKQGTERLQKLAVQSNAEGDVGRFASLAKLALADLQAAKLLGGNP